MGDAFGSQLRRRRPFNSEEVTYEAVDRPLQQGVTDEATVIAEEVAVRESLTMTSARLLATGAIGIFIAVGITIIFGALNGKKSKKELQSAVNDINTRIAAVDAFSQQVDNKIVEQAAASIKQINDFKVICTSLATIYPNAAFPPQFTWNNIPSAIDSLSTVIDTQKQALNYFILIPQLRTANFLARKRNPNVTTDEILQSVLISAPEWVTLEHLTAVWEITRHYSLATSLWKTKIDNRGHWPVSVVSSANVGSDCHH